MHLCLNKLCDMTNRHIFIWSSLLLFRRMNRPSFLTSKLQICVQICDCFSSVSGHPGWLVKMCHQLLCLCHVSGCFFVKHLCPIQRDDCKEALFTSLLMTFDQAIDSFCTWRILAAYQHHTGRVEISVLPVVSFVCFVCVIGFLELQAGDS